MSDKDPIKNQLAENFWDAIVNKAKQIKYQSKAALGSKYAQGQLNAHVLADNMYKAYVQWAGEQSHKLSIASVAQFLKSQVDLGAEFVNRELNVGHGNLASALPQGQGQAEGGGENSEWNDVFGSYHGDFGGSEAKQGSNTDSEEEDDPNAEYKPGEGDWKPHLVYIKPFMHTKVYKAFVANRTAKGFDPDPEEPISKDPDGTFLFAPTDKETDLKDLILYSEKYPDKAASEMKKDHFFITWNQFKKNIPGGDRIPKNSPAEADLFRQSVFAALKIYGKNFPKGVERFVLAIPPEVPDKGSTREDVYIVEHQDILNEDSIEGKLRKLFLKIAQDALRTGSFQAAMHTALDNGQNAPKQNDNGGSGNELADKAKKLGEYLGINLNKYELRRLNAKNPGAFNNFMHDLSEQDPNNWDPEFIKEYKRMFNVKGTTPAEANAKGQNTEFDSEKEAEESSPGDFMNIRGEHVKWDEQQGVLTIISQDPNKDNKWITREYEPLATGGWTQRSNGRQFAENNGFATKLNDLQHEYIEKTNMFGDQKKEEPNQAPESKSDVPFQAKVKVPKGGEYTFNGSKWVNGNGNEIPSDKSNQWLTDLYKKQSSGEQPEVEPVETPEKPEQAEKPTEPVQQPAQAAKPEQPEQPQKPAAQEKSNVVPLNATFKIPKTNRVIQRKDDGWVDTSGSKITDPSKVAIFDRGWKVANGRSTDE
jgi:hypothetical protein